MSTPTTHTEKAGAFDIRNFIGALLGLYGLALLLLGVFDFGEAEAAKTGGVNASLWTGVALLASAAVFLVWARVNPLVIEVTEDPTGEAETDLAPKED